MHLHKVIVTSSASRFTKVKTIKVSDKACINRVNASAISQLKKKKNFRAETFKRIQCLKSMIKKLQSIIFLKIIANI